MVSVTTDGVPEMTVRETIGIVRGVVAWAAGISRNFSAEFSAVAEGEVDALTDSLERARRKCHNRMVAEAEDAGADAVLGVRYESNQLSHGVVELVAYGTAVILA